MVVMVDNTTKQIKRACSSVCVIFKYVVPQLKCQHEGKAHSLV